MRTLVCTLAAAVILAPGLVRAEAKKDKKGATVLNHKMKGLDGKEVDLSKFKGKVVLIVNVASHCGNTPQYKGLETLYVKHKDDGLVVLGVPANEFGKQEPGTDQEIAEFCSSKYNVTFPMLSKVVVKGPGITPLYKELTSDPKFGGPIEWNFAKFLIGRDGQVVARFKANVKPEAPDLVKTVEAELKK